ncbi:hypothetical protein ABZZ20_05670 [Streptomyces sp. NPDC006430]|uniref:hypothetical protein n=1 Tax=Streptomyces sp. NPDC006430 TaxID=3154299 RepID=UPI0033B58635
MTSISASARTSATGFAPSPAHPLKSGLVIENLDALPDTPHVLFTVCGLTQVTVPANPIAGRLEA